MNWKKLVKETIPVAATMTGNADVEVAATRLMDAVDAQLTNKAAASGKSRDDLLKEYQAQWDQNVDDADALLKKGHEE